MDWKPTGVDWSGGGNVGMVRFGEDRNLLVMFYNKSIHNAVKSREAGKPIHESRIYVKIQSPGETLNVIDRPMKDEDKERFPKQWSQFVHNRTQVPEGTPVALLFPNYPHVAENLQGLGIFTIEQCANLSASAIDNIGRGGQEYVNRAKAYLDSANKGVLFHELQAQLDEEKAKNKRLEHNMGVLQKKLEALESKLTNPLGNSLSPPFIQDYDPQSERINANHVTKELAKAPRRKIKAEQKPETILTDPFANKVENETVSEYEEMTNE